MCLAFHFGRSEERFSAIASQLWYNEIRSSGVVPAGCLPGLPIRAKPPTGGVARSARSVTELCLARNSRGRARHSNPLARESKRAVPFGKSGAHVSTDSHQFVCLYGHFYQPPREDPFTVVVPPESGAAPYPIFNQKVTIECYQPNATEGNFEHISFDLGPTLATWLEQHHSGTYSTIIEADRRNVARYGVGNELAQAYNPTILPLAPTHGKRTQIVC